MAVVRIDIFPYLAGSSMARDRACGNQRSQHLFPRGMDK